MERPKEKLNKISIWVKLFNISYIDYWHIPFGIRQIHNTVENTKLFFQPRRGRVVLCLIEVSKDNLSRLLTTNFILICETCTSSTRRVDVNVRRECGGKRTEIVANERDRLRSQERKEIPFYTDSHFIPTRGDDGLRKMLRMLYGKEPTYLLE